MHCCKQVTQAFRRICHVTFVRGAHSITLEASRGGNRVVYARVDSAAPHMAEIAGFIFQDATVAWACMVSFFRHALPFVCCYLDFSSLVAGTNCLCAECRCFMHEPAYLDACISSFICVTFSNSCAVMCIKITTRLSNPHQALVVAVAIL